MRVYVYHTIGMIACVALQSAWPMWLGLSGCFPDLVLALTLVTGLARGPQEGFTVGFLGAFLLGSSQGLPFAPLFIKLMAVGFAAGLLRGRLVSDRALVAMLLTFAATIAVRLVTLILAPPLGPGMWLKETIIQAPYTALLAAPMFSAVNILNRDYPLRIDR